MAKKAKRRVADTMSLADWVRKFSTEHKAMAWLERVRWNGRPVCCHCGGSGRVKRRGKPFQYWCGECRSHFNARMRTIMHASKMPTRHWLVGIYYVMTARKGVSSLQLSKELGITQKSAWFMLHRIRAACAGRNYELSDIVEVDETYIGGKERNKHESKKLKAGRGSVGKAPVLGMRERGTGRVRAAAVPDTTKETLHGEIERGVAKGSTLYTDEHGSYDGIEEKGYGRKAVNHSAKQFVDGMASTNGVESMWSILKRMHYGTYHHFSVKHLQRYVDECAFRLNDGNCEVDTIDRVASLIMSGEGKNLDYRTLTGKPRPFRG